MSHESMPPYIAIPACIILTAIYVVQVLRGRRS